MVQPSKTNIAHLAKHDKTEDVFRMVYEWKKLKTKGKMTLHFDGSGIVARAEIQQDL